MSEWYSCAGFDKYEMTKEGLVRHKINKNNLKLSKNKSGYPFYRMMCNRVEGHSKTANVPIHQLMMATFGEPGEGEVHHIDGDKNNFSLGNLIRVSRRENLEEKELFARCRPIIYKLKDKYTDEEIIKLLSLL